MWSPKNMNDFLHERGLDVDKLQWQDLAACNNMPLGLFFELYETDKVVAREVDNICFLCCVRNQCLAFGKRQKETGVWGGVYLINGEPDSIRNKHKSVKDQ